MNILLNFFKGLLLGSATIVFLALVMNAPPMQVPNDSAPTTETLLNKMSAIVRLHDTSTGKFFCSGVVISSKLIATAAHCVVQFSMFGSVSKLSEVNIRGADGKDLKLIAKVDGAHPGSDTAILSGDFSRFVSLPLVNNVKEDLSILLDNSKLLISCGYPWGAELYCVEFYSRSYYTFHVQGKSYLFPGMSGGPVIEVETGKVVALNRAVGGEFVYVSPTLGIFVNTAKDK